MARYIEESELIAGRVPNDPVVIAVKCAKTADVVERKKGKWIPKEDRAKQEVFICSVCGGWAYSPWIGSRKNPKPNWCKYLFCPNCGADMQMESQEEVK